MSQDDPEQRIAELERQPAEPKHVTAAQHRRPVVTPDDVHVVTPEDVRNVAFSQSATARRGHHDKPGYNENEVDSFLERIAATLRDPASGGVTAADIRNVTFSKPPLGKRGYDQDEVDAFLGRVEAQLKSQQGGHPPHTASGEPTRCLLHRRQRWNPPKPVLAIEVDKHAIRVTDLDSNALIGSASLAEVTANPAHHGGAPVLVLGVPGLPPLSIQPHLEEGFSRRAQPGRLAERVKQTKPDYLVTDPDWVTLVEKFPVELPEISTPRKILNHVLRFIEESHPRSPTTWRTPLIFGLLFGVPAAIFWNPLYLAIGVALLILAALAWYFGWEL